MRLTTKSRYGTRLILDIALYGMNKPVPLKDIAARQNISVKYLEQITGSLKKAGILTSFRGPSGGHRLARPPEEISIGLIVRALEGPTVIDDCEEQENEICGICSKDGQCLSRWIWVEASRAMFERLDRITIASLLELKDKKFKEKWPCPGA